MKLQLQLLQYSDRMNSRLDKVAQSCQAMSVMVHDFAKDKQTCSKLISDLKSYSELLICVDDLKLKTMILKSNVLSSKASCTISVVKNSKSFSK